MLFKQKNILNNDVICILHDHKHPNYNILFNIYGQNSKWPPMNQDGDQKNANHIFLK